MEHPVDLGSFVILGFLYSPTVEEEVIYRDPTNIVPPHIFLGAGE